MRYGWGDSTGIRSGACLINLRRRFENDVAGDNRRNVLRQTGNGHCHSSQCGQADSTSGGKLKYATHRVFKIGGAVETRAADPP